MLSPQTQCVCLANRSPYADRWYTFVEMLSLVVLSIVTALLNGAGEPVNAVQNDVIVILVWITHAIVSRS